MFEVSVICEITERINLIERKCKMSMGLNPCHAQKYDRFTYEIF
jgi:hypothetical protein